ncbi:asparagine synthase-related protein [Rhodanobacter ginsengisoli]|uniref:asparagine synthase (glutamine-hydrolyzing) n=1 Tax=Rhodanobacter ginsengisoli TaxID=418646 RepID=A0ABW0QLA2_9GAMM
MTGFVGVYAKTEAYVIPEHHKSEMRKVLSRTKSDNVDLFDSPKFCLASYDIGAYESPSLLLSEDGSVTKIAGRAYVNENTDSGRLHDSRALTEALRCNDQKALISARGSFCGIVYFKPQHRAYLFTDMMGVRPIYLADCGPYLAFSTSFRALTTLSFVYNHVDEIGAMQQGRMGYSTGARTSISNVSVTVSGELISLDGSKVSRSRYYKIEDTAESMATESELADVFYRSFINSVKLRCETENRHRSLLSGGLDSRLIVSALRIIGVEVDTFCMASTGQQDYLFSKLFADVVGSTHRFIYEKDGFRHQANRLKQYTSYQKSLGNHSDAHLLWSGDGGSVGLGFVYLDQDLDNIQTEDSLQAALHELAEIKGNGLSSKLMNKSLYEDFRVKYVDEMFQAMMISPNESVDRNLRFYYLLNDQRCHLHQSIEDIDLHRVEFVLPFFDAELIKVMASIPYHMGRQHRFYTTVMGNFPASVSTIPWQAYPNHDPCPLPIPDDLIRQWDEADDVTRASTRSRAAEIIIRALGPHFPALYSRPRILMLALFECMGLSHRSYAFGPFLTLARAIDLETK